MWSITSVAIAPEVLNLQLSVDATPALAIVCGELNNEDNANAVRGIVICVADLFSRILGQARCCRE